MLPFFTNSIRNGCLSFSFYLLLLLPLARVVLSSPLTMKLQPFGMNESAPLKHLFDFYFFLMYWGKSGDHSKTQ